MTFEINIIYTPRTAKYLSTFIWSLLKWPDCCFRVVSNGCSLPERFYLQQLCTQSHRLEFWAIPTKNALPHDQALVYLQALTDSDCFCFIDSDIFATGDCLSDLAPYLNGYAAVFSGTPLWTRTQDEILPPTFQIVSGLHQLSHRRECLGNSYFAMYNNQALTDVIQSTGIGFGPYRWHEIPAHYQRKLAEAGLARSCYDTGKLLNFVLRVHHQPLYFENVAYLYHIGGVSFEARQARQRVGIRDRLLTRAARGKLKRAIETLNKHRAKAAYRDLFKERGLSENELEVIVEQRKRHRNPVRRYFWQLLRALHQGTALPRLPVTGDAEIDDKVRSASTELRKLFTSIPKELTDIKGNRWTNETERAHTAFTA